MPFVPLTPLVHLAVRFSPSVPRYLPPATRSSPSIRRPPDAASQCHESPGRRHEDDAERILEDWLASRAPHIVQLRLDHHTNMFNML